MLYEPDTAMPSQRLRPLNGNASHSEIIMPTPQEFAFHECLAYLGRSALEPLHCVEAGSVTKVVQVEQANVLLRVQKHDSRNLRLTVSNCTPISAVRSSITRYVNEWFDLGRPLNEFYHVCGHDEVLSGLVRRYFGLRLLVIHDLFQALCWAVLGQQINLAFAYALYARFVHTFGKEVEFEQTSYWLFPRPSRIARLSVKALTTLQITSRKAEYLIGIAREIAAGRLSKTGLLALHNLERAKSTLLKVRGVGPWTANYVLLRCLGLQNAFPVEDVGLHHAIKKQLAMNRKPTMAEILKLARGWKNWEGYATFYLYRSLL